MSAVAVRGVVEVAPPRSSDRVKSSCERLGPFTVAAECVADVALLELAAAVDITLSAMSGRTGEDDIR